MVVAHVKTPSGTVIFASTHLDHTGGPENDRLEQANAIVDLLKSEKSPTIIGGDFNSVPASEPIKSMTAVVERFNPRHTNQPRGQTEAQDRLHFCERRVQDD